MRYGDCGFFNNRNGVFLPTTSLGTCRRPVSFRNGRLSTGLLFGCGQTRGGGRGALGRLLPAFGEASINGDGIHGVGVAISSKIRLK